MGRVTSQKNQEIRNEPEHVSQLQSLSVFVMSMLRL